MPCRAVPVAGVPGWPISGASPQAAQGPAARQCRGKAPGWWDTGFVAPPRWLPETGLGWTTTLREAKGWISRPKCSPGLGASGDYSRCLSLGTKLQCGKLFPCLVRGGRLAQAEGDPEYPGWIPALNHLLGPLPIGCKGSVPILKEQLPYILRLKMSMHLHF